MAYQPYTWKNKELITAEKLNRMEQGIAEGGGDGTGAGVVPTIGSNGNWYIGTEDTGKPSRGEKGDKGAPGTKGDKGDPGSDASVTAANIKAALGYTPADSEDIPTVPESLKNPNALTIKIGSTTVTYDGSSAQTVEIADGTEVSY